MSVLKLTWVALKVGHGWSALQSTRLQTSPAQVPFKSGENGLAHEKQNT